jgi:hypothetical protein
VQRAYIAALSLTGSDRAACRAVAKSAFGVNQLLAHEGSDGFAAAREQALAIAADERSRRLAEGLRTVAAEQSGWRPPEPPWAGAATRRGRPPGSFDGAPEPEPEMSLEDKERAIEGILVKYLYKVEAERKARLEGKIVAADFYLRQMTCIEVALDLLSGGGFMALHDFRLKGYHLCQIAETPISKIMGDLRREKWAAMGDPPRPEHPPARYLEDEGGFSIEPNESFKGGPPAFQERQRQTYEDRHRQDAEAQLRWEAEARRDYERRRAAAPLVDEEPGSAGQPAPGPDPGDRTDVTDSLRDGPPDTPPEAPQEGPPP